MKLSRLIAACVVVVSFAACQGPATPPVPAALSTPDPAQTLAALNVSGRLVFTNNPHNIKQLDLASGAISTLFQPPENGYVMSSAVSPDQTVLAMAYQPPPEDPPLIGIPQYGYTDIYLLPFDEPGEPTLYLSGESDKDILILPFWSPDGKYLYYIHYLADADSYNLERVIYPDTEPETIVEHVLFAAISPDGSKLVYLKQVPHDVQLSLNVSDSSGANEVELVSAYKFFAMDTATFTPDGESVVFSAVGQTRTEYRTRPILLTDWFGEGVALNGNLPADLWRIPVDGGTPQQITSFGGMSIYPAYSPDGSTLAVLAKGGIYLAGAEGQSLFQFTSEGAIGTLQWVP